MFKKEMFKKRQKLFHILILLLSWYSFVFIHRIVDMLAHSETTDVSVVADSFFLVTSGSLSSTDMDMDMDSNKSWKCEQKF